MKRQRSRNRSNGTGGKPQHNANRAFESNGPEGVKIRGAAQHVFEKYQQLARDALTAGDRVLAESYQQHAEHYFRVLRAVQPNRSASDIIGRDAFASGYDIDFEDEGNNEPEPASESQDSAEADRGEWRQENRYEGRDRQREDRPRDDRPRMTATTASAMTTARRPGSPGRATTANATETSIATTVRAMIAIGTIGPGKIGPEKTAPGMNARARIAPEKRPLATTGRAMIAKARAVRAKVASATSVRAMTVPNASAIRWRWSSPRPAR